MRTKEKENVEFCLLIWNFMLFEVGLMCWVGGFSLCWNKSIKVSAVSFAKVTHKKRILWLHYSLCARLECRQLIALWEQARRLPFYVDVLIFHCDNDADEKVFYNKVDSCCCGECKLIGVLFDECLLQFTNSGGEINSLTQQHIVRSIKQHANWRRTRRANWDQLINWNWLRQ